MARMPQQYPRLSLRDNPTGTSLVLLTFTLLALGVVFVPSSLASLKTKGEWFARVDYRHVIYAVAAGLVLAMAWRFDYRRLLGKDGFPWRSAGLLLFCMALSVLVWAPHVGKAVGGYHRWVQFGAGSAAITFQPSELIKLALVVFLSAWLSSGRVKVRSIWTFLSASAIILVCVGTVVTQDFGTAAIIGVSAGVCLLLAGVPWYYLGSLLIPAAGAFWALVVHNPMRWQRMQTMMDPWSGYQTRQALLAIMSGGWFGKGLGCGVVKLGYLPERSTDYIFAVICEEAGVLGGAFLLCVLLVWIFQARRAAMNASSRFGQLLAGSLSFVIAVQALLHIAVNLAVAPPKGIGLPFVSAGGTSMVIMAAAVAMVVSVTSRRAASPEASLQAVAAAA